MRLLATPGRIAGMCALLAGAAGLTGCEVGGALITIPPLDAASTDESAPFVCVDESSKRCAGNSHLSCVRYDEFLEVVEVDCTVEGKVCHPEHVCQTCTPDSSRCNPCDPGDEDCEPNQTQMCNDDGT